MDLMGLMGLMAASAPSRIAPALLHVESDLEIGYGHGLCGVRWIRWI